MKKKNLFISSFSALVVACVSLFIAFAVISDRPVKASAETTTQQIPATGIFVDEKSGMWIGLYGTDYGTTSNFNNKIDGTANYDALLTLNTLNKIKVDGSYLASDNSNITAVDPYINLWNKLAGSFRFSKVPKSEVIVEQGCQFPSLDYWSGNADGVIYEVEETAKFTNESGTWAKVTEKETDISDTFSVAMGGTNSDSRVVSLSTTADISAPTGDGKWLMNNMEDLQNYIMLNGKSVKEINDETDDSSYTYTTFPATIGGVFAVPVRVLFKMKTSGNVAMFDIYIHNDYYATLPEGYTVGMKAGFVRSNTESTANMVVNTDAKFRLINGSFFPANNEADATINMTTGLKGSATDAKGYYHAYVYTDFFKGNTGIGYHIVQRGQAYNYLANYIYLNGKSVAQINAETDVTDWDWKGDFGAGVVQVAVLLYVSEDTTTDQPTRLEFKIHENYMNTIDGDITATIKAGAMLYDATDNVIRKVASDISSDIYYKTYKLTINVEGKEPAVLDAKHTLPLDFSSFCPDKEGYTFSGWYTNAELTEEATATTMPASDYAVYGKYNAIEYTATVTLADNTQKTVKYTIESREAKLAEIKAMLGTNDAQYTYTNNLPEVLPLEDKAYTETRTVNEYDVVIGDASAVKVAYGSKLTKPATDPTKDMTASTVYTFDGWYNGSTKWDFDNDTVTGNVTLTAKFTETARKYTVTITFTGLEKEAVTLQVEYNGSVDFNAYKEDGYDMVIKNGETEITELTVMGDVNITVEYNEAKKSGCNLSASGLGIVMLVMLTGSVVAIAMNKKKKEL